MPRLPTVTGDPAADPPVLPEWSYIEPGHDGFGQVDVIRLLIQDNDPAVPLISDMEIQWHVDEWLPKHDSLYMVAAQVAERIAAKFAGVVSVSADGVSVNVGDIFDRYTVVAEQMRASHKDAQVGGEVDITNLMWDQDFDWSIKPLSFGIGMDDNLEAGRQDYGSNRYGVGGAWFNELTGP